MPPTPDSIPLLRFRAWIALGLVFGFYTLSIAVAGILLLIAYQAILHFSVISLKVIIFCLLGAGTILWSIVPRVERFELPGPEIEPQKEPRFFREMEQIAQLSGQPVPHVVYLSNDMNAGVFRRGGILGRGSRSFLVVGLPLVCAMTISQFRAVLAHEFGHFYGGDTKLAPWIYRTTKAIVRTLTLLAERKSHLSFLFEWYGQLFVRTTRSISRHQEFAADALGARLAGPKAMQEGLQAIHRLDMVSEVYWQSEVQPVLNSGFRPSLANGFKHFLSASWCQELISHPEIEQIFELDEEAAIYNTHPPLQERIAALKNLPQGDAPVSDAPAITLFDHLDEAEERLVVFLQKSESKLPRIAWEDVGKAVYVPEWNRTVQQQAKALAGITPASLANIKSRSEFQENLRNPPDRLLTRDERERFGLQVLGTGLALALYHQGWELYMLPGIRELRRDGIAVSPFTTVFKLSSHEITAEAWLEKCKQARISDIDLSHTIASSAAGDLRCVRETP